jgi:hypothetical protein
LSVAPQHHQLHTHSLTQVMPCAHVSAYPATREGWFQSPERVKKRSSRHSHQEQQQTVSLQPGHHSSPPDTPTWAPRYGGSSGRSSPGDARASVHQQQQQRVKPREPVPRFDSGSTAATAGVWAVAAAGDRVLKQLLQEGIEQTAIGGGGGGGAHRRDSGRASEAADSGGEASEGHYHHHRRQQQQPAPLSWQQLQQLHSHSGERVLLERIALQAAQRAASPAHHARSTSPDVGDAAISAAAAAAAAAEVVGRSSHHRGHAEDRRCGRVGVLSGTAACMQLGSNPPLRTQTIAHRGRRSCSQGPASQQQQAPRRQWWWRRWHQQARQAAGGG